MPRKKSKPKPKNWTKIEKYWFEKRLTKLVITVIVYFSIGNWLLGLMMALTKNGILNKMEANIIVFGTISFFIWTGLDIFDKK